MSPIQKNVGRVAVLAALGSITASVGAHGGEESSVLVDPEVQQAAAAPELTPPANQSTLPPPQRPAPAEPAPLPTKPAAKRPFLRPAVPKLGEAAPAELTSDAEPIPVPESAASELPVRPTPPIEYDTDGDARRMYRHTGQIELVMVTQNPADGCYYEIPLCIPGCCVGEPTMSAGHGIFGRGVVEYCWPSCGFRAIVKFRHVLGDVRVDYEGD
jgi:hypothetical protein